MLTNEIKIIGVGGAGNNVLVNLAKGNLKNTDYIACSTDVQFLAKSPLQNKIQIGVTTTKGVGTGGSIELGKLSAIESKEQIEQLFDENSKTAIFIAGLGGGTGTGATPVMVQMAKAKQLFTIAIVYTPFRFEGESRYKIANEGIVELKKYTDFVLVIDNNKIHKAFGSLGFKPIFEKSNKAVEQLIKVLLPNDSTSIYVSDININTKKIKQGKSVFFGFAEFHGTLKENKVIEDALKNALSDREDIVGVVNVFVNINHDNIEITVDELEEINSIVLQKAGSNPNLIITMEKDCACADSVSVAIIAS